MFPEGRTLGAGEAKHKRQSRGHCQPQSTTDDGVGRSVEALAPAVTHSDLVEGTGGS